MPSSKPSWSPQLHNVGAPFGYWLPAWSIDDGPYLDEMTSRKVYQWVCIRRPYHFRRWLQTNVIFSGGVWQHERWSWGSSVVGLMHTSWWLKMKRFEYNERTHHLLRNCSYRIPNSQSGTPLGWAFCLGRPRHSLNQDTYLNRVITWCSSGLGMWMDMGDGERDDGKDTTTHGLYSQLLNCLLSCRHNSLLSALHICTMQFKLLTRSMTVCQSWLHVGMGKLLLPFSRNQTCISDILSLELSCNDVGNTYCQHM